MKGSAVTPRLSVLLVTYNHERYVVRALESLFNQDYTGDIELVVADDASTDGTLQLIRGYEGSDARFSFKYLDAGRNVGITRNYQRGFAACTGDYVAVLEGDDYWISPRKLSRQSSFLCDHWECGLCSVNYFVFCEDRATFSERVPVGNGHRLLGARDLIADNLVGNFSTCMYRKSALDALPAGLFEVRSYDWIVNICVATNSLVGFLEEPMSVYRVHSSGAWSNFQQLDKLRLQLSLIPAYDQITGRRFREEFGRLESKLLAVISRMQVSQLTSYVMRPTEIMLSRIRDFVPPVVIVIWRALMPPIIAQRLFRNRDKQHIQ